MARYHSLREMRRTEVLDGTLDANKRQAARILVLERGLELAAARFDELRSGSSKRAKFCELASADARGLAREGTS